MAFSNGPTAGADGAAKGGYYTSELSGFRLFGCLHGLMDDMGPVTSPRIEVFAGHICQYGVPLLRRCEPVILLPVLTEKTIE